VIDWCRCSDGRGKWELEDLKQFWREEMKKGQLQLEHGWQNIINNIVKYVSISKTIIER